MLKMIVAADNNWAIGKNNGLIYNLKQDMKHFKSTTEFSIVVMGYKTFLSLPKQKPLKNRINVVLCSEGHDAPGCIVYHDFDEMIHDITIAAEIVDVYIIGGATLYAKTIDYVDEVILTKIDASCEDATAFFPDLNKKNNFEIVYNSVTINDNSYNTRYMIYRKRA